MDHNFFDYGVRHSPSAEEKGPPRSEDVLVDKEGATTADFVYDGPIVVNEKSFKTGERVTYHVCEKEGAAWSASKVVAGPLEADIAQVILRCWYKDGVKTGCQFFARLDGKEFEIYSASNTPIGGEYLCGVENAPS